jgi:predicted transcriptional regulator
MKVSGFSEKAIKKLTLELDKNNIPYTISIDESIVERNEEHRTGVLSYLNPSGISTDILSLEIEEHFLVNIKDRGLVLLLEENGFYLGEFKLISGTDDGSKDYSGEQLPLKLFILRLFYIGLLLMIALMVI